MKKQKLIEHGPQKVQLKFKRFILQSLFTIPLFIGILGFNQRAEAVVSDTTTITVTIAGSLSVSIGSATYGLGTRSLNEFYVSTGAIPVTNNSASLTEDWQIRGSSSANWNPHSSTNTGNNNFNLRVLISTTGSAGAPGYSNFDTGMNNTGLQDGVGNNKNLTNMLFGFGSSGHGDNIAVNTTRYLWFRFIAPAAITAGGGTEQSISLIVTAADASTYANE